MKGKQGHLRTVLSAQALKPEESSWKQQSKTAPACINSPFNKLAVASYKRTLLSQDETKRWSLLFENRRFEIPSVGGFDNSRPIITCAIITKPTKIEREGRREGGFMFLKWCLQFGGKRVCVVVCIGFLFKSNYDNRVLYCKVQV